MRARTQEWHKNYAMPSIWKFWEPDRENHGSFYYDWTTADEVSWKRFIHRYMQLINDYKSIGGRVAGGTDAGFIYSLYGFAAIRELELMQEAGFTANEAINAYTRQAARTLTEPKGVEPEFGMVRVGQMADLIVTPENPLANFKTLYGTGTGRLNDATGKIERVGGIRWTVRNGVVYDAKKLLADVAADGARRRRTPAAAPASTSTGARPARAAAPARPRRRSRRRPPRRPPARPDLPAPPVLSARRARRATRATRPTSRSPARSPATAARSRARSPPRRPRATRRPSSRARCACRTPSAPSPAPARARSR